MTEEEIQGFTNRIVAGNRSQIICVLFDIYSANENDALESFANNDRNRALKGLNKCSEVLLHLKNALDFNYDISKNLYSLYDFCQREVSRSIYQANSEGLLTAKPIITKLAEAFEEVARQDKSSPVMQNVQEVHAGYTYGKFGMNEQIADGSNRPRGFFA